MGRTLLLFNFVFKINLLDNFVKCFPYKTVYICVKHVCTCKLWVIV